MANKKYVAYVATYTHEKDNNGIKIFDVDVEKGCMSFRDVVPITNPSYFTISHSKKYVYSITDTGVEAFKILPDGNLKMINKATINGMRGNHISTDYEDKFLFVAGYHDGKLTVLRLHEDGSAGEILDEVYHKGLGSIAERNFRPHISCVKMTRDNKYLCAADLGVDHVKVYHLNHETGKLKLTDVVRSELDSAPHYIKFSKDGRFAYIIHELKNIIDVYSYEEVNNDPQFTKIQTVSTLNDYHSAGSAACAMKLTEDGNHLFCSNAGDNSISAYRVDKSTGMLDKIFTLPISGDYPKDFSVFPDNRHVVSLNHENGGMTFFSVDLEKGLLVMNAKSIPMEKGNCIAILGLDG